MWMISPNYKNTDFPLPPSLEDKITIFLDRTYGWQLDIADKCINGEADSDGNLISGPIRDSGFAVLHIILSYFEMIAKFQDGFAHNGQSIPYFKKGVLSVFGAFILRAHPEDVVHDLLQVLYLGARCGLYHGGITDRRIVLTGEPEVPIAFDPQHRRLVINPHRLVPALKSHLEGYGRQLRDPTNTQLRENFERRFDFQET